MNSRFTGRSPVDIVADSAATVVLGIQDHAKIYNFLTDWVFHSDSLHSY